MCTECARNVHGCALVVHFLCILWTLVVRKYSKGGAHKNSPNVHESLKMLDEERDLDFVLIEDWLFRSPHEENLEPKSEH